MALIPPFYFNCVVALGERERDGEIPKKEAKNSKNQKLKFWEIQNPFN